LTAKEKNEMTEIKEKISRPFAFLKFANPHCTHYQAPQAQAKTEACQRAVFFKRTFCTIVALK